MLLLTFNPGLTLTGFQTTQPRWLTKYFFFSQHEAIKSPTLHLSLSLSLSVFLRVLALMGKSLLLKCWGYLLKKIELSPKMRPIWAWQEHCLKPKN